MKMLDRLPHDIIYEIFLTSAECSAPGVEQIIANIKTLYHVCPTLFAVYKASQASLLRLVLKDVVGSERNVKMAMELAHKEVRVVIGHGGPGKEKTGGEKTENEDDKGERDTGNDELNGSNAVGFWGKENGCAVKEDSGANKIDEDDAKYPVTARTYFKAMRNHVLISRLAHLANAVSDWDVNDSKPLKFSEDHDEAMHMAETAIYTYATKGMSGKDAELFRSYSKTDKRWDICFGVYTCMEAFIYGAIRDLDDRVPVSFRRRTQRFNDDFEAFTCLVEQCTPFTGAWRILGHLRGAWGEHALDFQWMQEHEKRGRTFEEDCEECVLEGETLEYWFGGWGYKRWAGYKLFKKWSKLEKDSEDRLLFGVDLPCKWDVHSFKNHCKRSRDKKAREM